MVVVSPSSRIIINDAALVQKGLDEYEEDSLRKYNYSSLWHLLFKKEICPGTHRTCMVFNLAHGGIAFLVGSFNGRQ